MIQRMYPEKYGVKHFIKFGDYNIGRDGDLLTLPTYMQFLLDLEPEGYWRRMCDKNTYKSP